MTKEYKLDIFWLFGELNKGRLDIWDSLTDEQRKGFSPLIVMQWMSGCNDYNQIYLLEQLVNPMVFPLAKHPKLLMMLLAVANTHKQRRYYWITMKSSKEGKKKKSLEVLKEYYGYSTREATINLPLVSNEKLLEIANDLGWQKDEINILKKEL